MGILSFLKFKSIFNKRKLHSFSDILSIWNHIVVKTFQVIPKICFMQFWLTVSHGFEGFLGQLQGILRK